MDQNFVTNLELSAFGQIFVIPLSRVEGRGSEARGLFAPQRDFQPLANSNMHTPKTRSSPPTDVKRLQRYMAIEEEAQNVSTDILGS